MVIKHYSGTNTPKPRFFIIFDYSEWIENHRVFSLYMQDYIVGLRKCHLRAVCNLSHDTADHATLLGIEWTDQGRIKDISLQHAGKDSGQVFPIVTGTLGRTQ